MGVEPRLEFGGLQLGKIAAVGSHGYLSRFLEDASTPFYQITQCCPESAGQNRATSVCLWVAFVL
jgi:hypothetical protein